MLSNSTAHNAKQVEDTMHLTQPQICVSATRTRWESQIFIVTGGSHKLLL